MTEKQIKNYIKRLYAYKKINDNQFKNAINNLEKLRDSDLVFYYFNMGKLHTAFGNAEDAIFYLEKTIMLEPNHPPAYYNLYKCYAKLNDMKKAQVNLKNFLELNTVDVNFELVVNVMNAIDVIDRDFFEYLEEDFSVQYISKFGYNNLDDNDELKDIYFEVLKAFNARDYLTCISKLELMNSKIIKIGYPMEVDTLIQMIKCLKQKEIMHYRLCIDDHRYREISDETYATILFHLYELGFYSAKSFLRKIEEIILNNSHIKGDIILDKISNVKDFENYQDMIGYLKGLVREKMAFSSLGETRQEEFTEKRLIAKNYYTRKQNELCLESYLALKNEFNLPVCDYYIGKNLFRLGYFSKARECFLNYLKQGGVKTEKAYMFLAKIERIKKNNDVANSYVKMIHRIHEIFLTDFQYLSDRQLRVLNDKGLANNYVENDVFKNHRMRTTKIKEKEFAKNDSLSIADFNNVNIDGKLAIIRDILRCGNIKKAQKLLDRVQQECTPQERPKVQQFQRNKKIYINQIRDNQS